MQITEALCTSKGHSKRHHCVEANVRFSTRNLIQKRGRLKTPPSNEQKLHAWPLDLFRKDNWHNKSEITDTSAYRFLITILLIYGVGRRRCFAKRFDGGVGRNTCPTNRPTVTEFIFAKRKCTNSKSKLVYPGIF